MVRTRSGREPSPLPVTAPTAAPKTKTLSPVSRKTSRTAAAARHADIERAAEDKLESRLDNMRTPIQEENAKGPVERGSATILPSADGWLASCDKWLASCDRLMAYWEHKNKVSEDNEGRHQEEIAELQRRLHSKDASHIAYKIKHSELARQRLSKAEARHQEEIAELQRRLDSKEASHIAYKIKHGELVRQRLSKAEADVASERDRARMYKEDAEFAEADFESIRWKYEEACRRAQAAERRSEALQVALEKSTQESFRLKKQLENNKASSTSGQQAGAHTSRQQSSSTPNTSEVVRQHAQSRYCESPPPPTPQLPPSNPSSNNQSTLVPNVSSPALEPGEHQSTLDDCSGITGLLLYVRHTGLPAMANDPREHSDRYMTEEVALEDLPDWYDDQDFSYSKHTSIRYVKLELEWHDSFRPEGDDICAHPLSIRVTECVKENVDLDAVVWRSLMYCEGNCPLASHAEFLETLEYIPPKSRTKRNPSAFVKREPTSPNGKRPHDSLSSLESPASAKKRRTTTPVCGSWLIIEMTLAQAIDGVVSVSFVKPSLHTR